MYTHHVFYQGYHISFNGLLQQVQAFTKSLVYVSHTINVKTDFNSLGFLTCKYWLNRLNSKMQRVDSKGLNEISSRLFTIKHVGFYKSYFFVEYQSFVTLSWECYKLRLAVLMYPPTLKVKLPRLMYIP